ncbi:LacI family DNA-binding transcriptional regulator [Maribius pontilimi]|uniref:LacI family DNA-binding transcriptional regulator n=1 Tax=Palleronia pontilimi TaxID=1964209 RepID=A0A934IG39_9RHOB|nr:LacI family DNA-binding transcriptional regulator [Palleronia pontilimi]MBJ3761945.1 LacI family DNA-binding transcriptional regulator [Palleronia pontilimi]
MADPEFQPDPAVVKRSAPTVEDVARAAGVSTATVSRCLNMPAKVGEATRTRVLKVVAELGYSPNFGARALAAKRTRTIGAIVPTMENAIFARGLQAFQEELGLHGYTLLVASSSYSPEREADQIRTLVARGADALLLIGFDRAPAITEWLEARAVPHVIAWAYDADAKALSVGFDNREAMRALASEVFARGHRRVAVLTAPIAQNDRARERLAGVRAAAAEAGLDPDTLRVVETPYSFDNGAAQMDLLMGDTPRPTAVICGNDILAAGAIAAARAKGLRVPGDVSVTGFDDIEIARVLDPLLTTVHVPHRDMGRACARDLIDILENGTHPASTELRTEVMLRGSLGPPAD